MTMSSFTQNDYEIVHREILYQGIFRLVRYQIRHRLFNGGWSEIMVREVLERRSAGAILPYDPQLDRVILIEQFRPGCLTHKKNPWVIEVPAGVIDREEPLEELARREAEEEAGCKITTIEKICDYFVSPGGSDEYLTLFCGKVDAHGVNGVHGLEHEQEDIRVINIPSEEAFERLKTGEIQTAPAVMSLLWLQANRARLQDTW